MSVAGPKAAGPPPSAFTGEYLRISKRGAEEKKNQAIGPSGSFDLDAREDASAGKEHDKCVKPKLCRESR